MAAIGGPPWHGHAEHARPLSGVCRCGHPDAVHFDEVLFCDHDWKAAGEPGPCDCERFWDRDAPRRPRPIPNGDPS